MDKKVIVKISPTGEVSFDALGFKGTECTEKTRGIIQKLGGLAKTELKPEYSEDVYNDVNLFNQ